STKILMRLWPALSSPWRPRPERSWPSNTTGTRTAANGRFWTSVFRRRRKRLAS
ncbi:unnamed protein product, partial [Candidula unifasciata]